MNPKTLILTGYGINGEEELAFGFSQAGAKTDIVHLSDLIDGTVHLSDYQILGFPGGFSYGDDTGAGNALANRIKNNLEEPLLAFARSDKLVIGICNGFQALANLGLAPALDGKYGERQAALDRNDSGRYQDRWIWLKTVSDNCIWLKGIDKLHLPIGHGEGKFTMPKEGLKKLEERGQIALRYVHENGLPANGEFPVNPNGAMMDIAGVTDPSGRILGLMPHPDRFIHPENEENWTLKKELAKRRSEPIPDEGAGMLIFRNAVGYFS